MTTKYPCEQIIIYNFTIWRKKIIKINRNVFTYIQNRNCLIFSCNGFGSVIWTDTKKKQRQCQVVMPSKQLTFIHLLHTIELLEINIMLNLFESLQWLMILWSCELSNVIFYLSWIILQQIIWAKSTNRSPLFIDFI